MIRNATPEDSSRIAEIQICGWRYAYRGMISDYELFSGRQVKKAIEKIEKKITEGCGMLVYEDLAEGEGRGIVKGFLSHGPARDPDLAGEYELYALYVQPEFAGCGIGTALMKAGEECARAVRCRKLALWVIEKNSAAIGLYRKLGYSPDGTIRILPEWQAFQIRMIKPLTEA